MTAGLALSALIVYAISRRIHSARTTLEFSETMDRPDIVEIAALYVMDAYVLACINLAPLLLFLLILTVRVLPALHIPVPQRPALRPQSPILSTVFAGITLAVMTLFPALFLFSRLHVLHQLFPATP